MDLERSTPHRAYTSAMEAAEIMDRGPFVEGIAESLGFSSPHTKHSHSLKGVVLMITYFYREPILSLLGVCYISMEQSRTKVENHTSGKK